jgi:hypothetical protein
MELAKFQQLTAGVLIHAYHNQPTLWATLLKANEEGKEPIWGRIEKGWHAPKSTSFL